MRAVWPFLSVYIGAEMTSKILTHCLHSQFGKGKVKEGIFIGLQSTSTLLDAVQHPDPIQLTHCNMMKNVDKKQRKMKSMFKKLVRYIFTKVEYVLSTLKVF